MAHLKEVKSHSTYPFVKASLANIMADADSLLTCTPLSVTDKETCAASGDPHDYLSQARYFWKDPSKPDGLPYINRDGITNPEIYKLDRIRLGETAERIKTLALAYYFSDDERYARKAAELIKVWFLDSKTAMNPNLEYAQVVPGQNGSKGRCYGVLDTYSFVELPDAVALLEGSDALKAKDSKKLKEWFGKLTDWMLTSEQGKEEGSQAKRYREHADKILASLTEKYRNGYGEKWGFLLDHSTGHFPGGTEIDVPLNYADYYYLEALLRQSRL